MEFYVIIVPPLILSVLMIIHLYKIERQDSLLFTVRRKFRDIELRKLRELMPLLTSALKEFQLQRLRRSDNEILDTQSSSQTVSYKKVETNG